MALVAERYCVDRFESRAEGGLGALDGAGTSAVAVSRRGAVPSPEMSWFQAQKACANAHKRLCTKKEWNAACRGPKGDRRLPSGTTWDAKACNGIAAPRAKGTRPSARPSGSFVRCRSVEADVWDLSGNLWEWIGDEGPGGLRPICGGGFGNAGNDLSCSCSEMERADKGHAAVGFRCCADPEPSAAGPLKAPERKPERKPK